MERKRTQVHLTTPNNNFRVLANDPSVRGWGYSVLDGNANILTTGCIRTEGGGKKMRIRKGDDNIRRITEICDVLKSVIEEWGVTYILSELPHGSQNASGAVMQGSVAGIAQTISVFTGIGIEWYSEGDSKKALLGRITAEKIDTMLAIDKIYNVPITKGIKKDKRGKIQALWSGVGYIDEAVADSLSIHYVASKYSSVLKMFKE